MVKGIRISEFIQVNVIDSEGFTSQIAYKLITSICLCSELEFKCRIKYQAFTINIYKKILMKLGTIYLE